MIDVSVIVPVYNTEKYLDRCLGSLAAQTLPSAEFIVIDDGSTDGSTAKIDEWAARDSRFVVIHQPNRGQAAARNAGLDAARGEFLMFCDSDDGYRPTTCERMVETIRREGVDLVQCRTAFRVEADISEAERNLRRSEEYFNPQDEGRFDLTDQRILRENVFLWNKIFRRDLVMRHGITFPDGHEADDDAFCHIYEMVSASVFHLPEQLYDYTIRTTGVMASYYRMKPRNREDALFAATHVIEFALKTDGLAASRLAFLQQMAGYHYRTCRDYFAKEERPGLLKRFNELLKRLPPPHKRILEAGSRLIMLPA